MCALVLSPPGGVRADSLSGRKHTPMRLWLASVLLATVLPVPVTAQVRLENPPEYVATLYRHILGREPSSGEVKMWVRNLLNGTPPDEVRATFIGSEEFYKNHYKDSDRFLI